MYTKHTSYANPVDRGIFDKSRVSWLDGSMRLDLTNSHQSSADERANISNFNSKTLYIELQLLANSMTSAHMVYVD